MLDHVAVEGPARRSCGRGHDIDWCPGTGTATAPLLTIAGSRASTVMLGGSSGLIAAGRVIGRRPPLLRSSKGCSSFLINFILPLIDAVGQGVESEYRSPTRCIFADPRCARRARPSKRVKTPRAAR